MSSTKKKVTQVELRRLMNEQKKKLQSNAKKIESPLAKYDKDGVLHCIVCETVVRSEGVWTVHLNSKNHKQNILLKVKKKDPASELITVSPPPAIKRPAVSVPVAIPPKKIKGILKNSSTSVTLVNKSNESNQENTSTSKSIVEKEIRYEKQSNNKCERDNIISKEDDFNDSTNQDVLPEGFFDDPKLDAKVRNVEYRDPIEDEWEQFQKEIREEESKAQQIIAEDQEEATTERQIDEIDEQIRNWSRVVTLEKKKETVSTNTGGQKSLKNQEEPSDDEDFEEFLDWRTKKSFDYKSSKLLSA